MMRISIFACLFCLIFACAESPAKVDEKPKSPISTPNPDWSDYKLEVFDEKVLTLFSEENKVEKLGEGYTWSEGPVWFEDQQKLIFSDVPNDVAYQWTKEDGVMTYLSPSGYTGTGIYSNEQGSNGLMIGADGSLYLCQHGNRALAKMKSPVAAPSSDFELIATEYNGKKLNSPNDLCQAADGSIYFTDPPYGLPGMDSSDTKELDFQGVYRWHPKFGISLIVDSLSKPNGIALAPGGKKLYVAVSDPQKAWWMKYSLDNEGLAYEGVRIHDATPNVTATNGLPDGLKVDRVGNIYASGPDGIWIFDRFEKLIGKIKVGQKIANCAIDEKREYLYLTAHSFLLRIPFVAS